MTRHTSSLAESRPCTRKVVTVIDRRTRPRPRAVPSHRRGSGLRVRDLRVRTKLLLVLTVPLLGFLGVTGVQVSTSIATAAQLDTFARQVSLGREVDTLVHELQRERDRTVGALAALAAGGTSRDLSFLSPDRTAVDRAAVALDQAARSLVNDEDFAAAYDKAADAMAGLAAIRDGAQRGWLRASAVFDAYTRIIGGLHDLLLVPAAIGDDADLGQAVRAFAAASRAKELMAQIRGYLYAICSAGRFGPGDFDAVNAARAQQQAAIAQLRDEAGPDAVAAWDEAVSGQAARNVSRLEQTVVDNARADDLGVEAHQWWQASTTQLERVRGAEEQLLEAAVAAADARSAQEWRSTQAGALLSALLLLVALLTSFAVGRIMVRTLQSLREQAMDVASYRLPEMIERLRTEPAKPSTIAVEPIAIQANDEVGEVAEAFTAVHRSAVRLAAEQALMRHGLNAIHVSLARRSQSLVERQLVLLDELESAEVDPDQLANLFRLDHLATRMRRNDENLLVLAGGDSERRWTDPIPLATVVLAAAAEIEHYARIRHDIADNLHLAGHAVADLVHLIAELLENATVFSPPETVVTVLGWTTDAGGAALAITDRGIGMSAEVLSRANAQVAAPLILDVAAAERMGLVVVGHLAHRHKVRVELSSTGDGVSVLVEMPAQLLAEPPVDQSLPPAGSASRRFVAGEPAAAGAEELTRPGEAGPARRAVPTRAEDVLGQGQVASDSVWWSREAQPASTGPVARKRPPVAVPADGGLPRRVPMEQLPESNERDKLARTDADPDEVGGTLTRFYDGVRRAATEEADEAGTTAAGVSADDGMPADADLQAAK